MNDQEIREVALVENLQRENLNPIESARAIQELISRHNLTQEKIAEKIGKSRPAVANTLRLLSLSPEVIKFIEEDKLSSGHARVLVVIENEELQIKIAEIYAKQIDMVMSSDTSEDTLQEYIQADLDNLESKIKSKDWANPYDGWLEDY